MEIISNRYKNLIRKKVELEVVTPLYLGGGAKSAQPNSQKAEFRIPSLRGMLRFWWRAIYGTNNLAEMRQREGEIFGNTSAKSTLLIRFDGKHNFNVSNSNLPPGTTFQVKRFHLGIIHYLGYGLQSFGENTDGNREFIPTKKTISLMFQYPKQIEDDISTALKHLHSFGGLGSRSRNGFGSVKLSGMDYLDSISGTGQVKSFTSLSEKSLVFSSGKEHSTWINALSEIGMAYRTARLSLERKHSFNRRSLLALPLISKEININKRQAKPYFLHVDKIGEGKYRGKILFMPYDYSCHQNTDQQKYESVCADMNKKIKEILPGGVK